MRKILNEIKCILYIALDKALFFIQKVSIFFLFLDENICCGKSLEAPQGASNEYPQHMFSSRNKKNINLLPTLIRTYMYVYVILACRINDLPVSGQCDWTACHPTCLTCDISLRHYLN